MTSHAFELLANDHGWGHMDGWSSGWMWLWGAAAILLVVVLVRAFAGASRSERADPSERARTILSERYARGELSTEEYRERLTELE